MWHAEVGPKCRTRKPRNQLKEAASLVSVLELKRKKTSKDLATMTLQLGINKEAWNTKKHTANWGDATNSREGLRA